VAPVKPKRRLASQDDKSGKKRRDSAGPPQHSPQADPSLARPLKGAKPSGVAAGVTAGRAATPARLSGAATEPVAVGRPSFGGAGFRQLLQGSEPGAATANPLKRKDPGSLLSRNGALMLETTKAMRSVTKDQAHSVRPMHAQSCSSIQTIGLTDFICAPMLAALQQPWCALIMGVVTH
jgi:hypothetical protein